MSLMALQEHQPGVMLGGKRKHLGAPDGHIAAKKARNDIRPSGISSPPYQPLQGLLCELSPKYDVKSLSILSSTSITKRIDSALQHLSRIDLYDPHVLPGIVLLYGRSKSTSKLITVAETVRRRIHEGGQKWYQYNRLYEMDQAVAPDHNPNQYQGQNRTHDAVQTLVEDTVMSVDGRDMEDEGEDDDDDFEVMQPRTVFERAVYGEEKVRQIACMSVLLSRIPIPELNGMENFAVQSNEEFITYNRRKKAGLAG